MKNYLWTKTYKAFNQFSIYRKTFNIYRKLTTREAYVPCAGRALGCELFTQVHF